MKGSKIFRFFLLVALFFFVFSATLLFTFPYKKAVKLLINGLFGESRSKISAEVERITPLSATLKRVCIGYEGVGALVEIKDVRLTVRPFEILKGVLRLCGKDGDGTFALEGIIPLRSIEKSFFELKFNGLEFSQKEGNSIVFTGLRGKLDGTLIKKVNPLDLEASEGKFNFVLRDGELENVRFGPVVIKSLPFRQIAMSGSSSGHRTKVDSISVQSPLGSISGNGEILSFAHSEIINLSISFNGFAPSFFPRIKGMKIYGNLLDPNSLTIQPL